LTQAEKLARKLWSTALVAADELVVLAAWLVSGRGLSNKAAITARRTGRNPYEAVIFAVIRGRNI